MEDDLVNDILTTETERLIQRVESGEETLPPACAHQLVQRDARRGADAGRRRYPRYPKSC